MSEIINENESKQSFLHLPQEVIGLKLDTAQLFNDRDKSFRRLGKLQKNASSQRLKESAGRLRLRMR
jgi:hypothetical protein